MVAPMATSYTRRPHPSVTSDRPSGVCVRCGPVAVESQAHAGMPPRAASAMCARQPPASRSAPAVAADGHHLLAWRRSGSSRSRCRRMARLRRRCRPLPRRHHAGSAAAAVADDSDSKPTCTLRIQTPICLPHIGEAFPTIFIGRASPDGAVASVSQCCVAIFKIIDRESSGVSPTQRNRSDR